MTLFRSPQAQQVSTISVRLGQVTTIPATSVAQTGLDITAIFNLMIPMMILLMVTKMMAGAMASPSAA